MNWTSTRHDGYLNARAPPRRVPIGISLQFPPFRWPFSQLVPFFGTLFRSSGGVILWGVVIVLSSPWPGHLPRTSPGLTFLFVAMERWWPSLHAEVVYTSHSHGHDWHPSHALAAAGSADAGLRARGYVMFAQGPRSAVSKPEFVFGCAGIWIALALADRWCSGAALPRMLARQALLPFPCRLRLPRSISDRKRVGWENLWQGSADTERRSFLSWCLRLRLLLRHRRIRPGVLLLGIFASSA